MRKIALISLICYIFLLATGCSNTVEKDIENTLTGYFSNVYNVHDINKSDSFEDFSSKLFKIEEKLKPYVIERFINEIHGNRAIFHVIGSSWYLNKVLLFDTFEMVIKEQTEDYIILDYKLYVKTIDDKNKPKIYEKSGTIDIKKEKGIWKVNGDNKLFKDHLFEGFPTFIEALEALNK